jgi:insertion element IS1 protein InsB
VGAGAAQKKSGDLVIEADELWSFVGSKADRWWVWAAIDADTRQVVAMVAGDRSARTARCLWDALPDTYRDGAVVCTYFLAGTRRAARSRG